MRTIFQRRSEKLPVEIQVWRPRAKKCVTVGEDVTIITPVDGEMLGTGFVTAVGTNSYYVQVLQGASDE